MRAPASSNVALSNTDEWSWRQIMTPPGPTDSVLCLQRQRLRLAPPALRACPAGLRMRPVSLPGTGCCRPGTHLWRMPPRTLYRRLTARPEFAVGFALDWQRYCRD